MMMIIIMMIINVNNVKIIMIIIIIMIRCEAPLSLPWEREVVQQLVVLAVLVATIRLVSSSIQAMIIVIVVNIIISSKAIWRASCIDIVQ